MSWRPPSQRPLVMRRLRAMYDAWARGNKGHALLHRLSLPNEVQAVLALCEYLGRFGDLHGRVRRTQPPTPIGVLH